MKIWYDALTGKHMRYGIAIAKALRKAGHKVILTTRLHPDTIPIAKLYREKVKIIGMYDPSTLLSRLRESSYRQAELCSFFEGYDFDVAVSHVSPDCCRVAYGLGKPIIATNDTPYAEAVNSLTIPLSNFVVTSESIPINTFQTYNQRANIITFKGVDEVAWIKGFKSSIYDSENLEGGRSLIVFRALEHGASYVTKDVDSVSIAKKLTKFGKVIFLSRYQRTPIKGLIVPDTFIDSASLVAQADLVVGFGGTINREAALQGTPSIVIKMFPDLYVNKYLAGKGFPIFESSIQDLVKNVKELIGKRVNVKCELRNLEDPTEVIVKLFRESEGKNMKICMSCSAGNCQTCSKGPLGLKRMKVR